MLVFEVARVISAGATIILENRVFMNNRQFLLATKQTNNYSWAVVGSNTFPMGPKFPTASVANMT